MDAKELRLGNLINIGGNTIDSYQTYKPHIVTLNIIEAIQDENKERPDAILSIWQPIPLTEEWLINLGFHLIERKGRYGNIYAIGHVDSRICIERDFHKHISYFVGIEYTDSPFENDENVTYNFSFNLKYVHQLQNLYFALTGEELTLKNE